MSRKSVSPHLEEEYEEFSKRLDPFGMAEELASARTLIVEFRESIEAGTAEKVAYFISEVQAVAKAAIRDIVGHALGIPEEERAENPKLSKLSTAVSRSMQQGIHFAYMEVFGTASRITPEQARTMAGLLKLVGDLAEKFKKMSEGVSLRVEYNQQVLDMMARFLSICVLPYCSMEQKAIIGQQAMRFLPSQAATLIDLDER